MLTKHLLATALILPLVAIPAAAHAGQTISDKSYWPSEARRSTQTQTVNSPRDLNSALAYDRAGSSLQPATTLNEAGSAWRYHGGPKGR